MNELFAHSEPIKTSEEPPQQSGLWADAVSQQAPPVYRVLARKYRPMTFDQLIGQEAMVRTISNAIETGRLPHAWMLTGVRGIGKTTTARIIARALNCTGIDGKGKETVHPCGQCDSCRTIAEDRHVDVLEMDAASRTGVDDIRDIIDGVRYGPVSARYKTYILDEVHMLSKPAFNALLKTLEEPPPHTKFIFATTEIRKVPVTVLSRCQRFDLRRIDSVQLTKHFTEVAGLEDVSAEPEAIKLLAHAADGSVRDGLSLLDQAIARGKGTITAVDVKEMLGLADRVHSLTLCRCLFRGEIKAALDSFTLMMQAGSDPMQVLQDMCDLVHLLTRSQIITDFAQDIHLPEYDRQLLTDLSDIKIPALARSWQILLKGIHEVQSAPDPTQAAEMVLIRLAYASELPLPGDLIKQLRQELVSINKANATEPSSPNSGPRAKLTGTSGYARPVVQSTPQTFLQVETTRQALPANYKEFVALFATNREGALHAQLHANIHPVRYEPGLLEMRVGSADVPANFASRLGQCLNDWTGQRWMISISDRPGEPTLAEQEALIEKQRHQRALEHPLTQAVVKFFPGAKLASLRTKIVPTVVRQESVETIGTDGDIAVELTEFED